MEFFNKYKDLFGVPQVMLDVVRAWEYLLPASDWITSFLSKKLIFPPKRSSIRLMGNFENLKRTTMTLSTPWTSSLECV